MLESNFTLDLISFNSFLPDPSPLPLPSSFKISVKSESVRLLSFVIFSVLLSSDSTETNLEPAKISEKINVEKLT